MIPSAYPISALLVTLVLLAAVLLAPCLRAFRRGWFILASALAVIWAGDKPTPPPGPTPPSTDVKIALADTTVSNVAIVVTCPTNYIGHLGSWQARRALNGGVPAAESGEAWSIWTGLSQSILIADTNEAHTVNGRFVSSRKDTQIRLVIDDDPTNEVTP